MPCPEKFRDSLSMFSVDKAIIESINEGYEELVSKSSKKLKAAYFKRAIDIMNEMLDREKVRQILEWNACCTTGAREKASKAFAKENGQLSLAQKLEKIHEVPNMGKPELNPDGTITLKAVSYFVDGKYMCACSNFSKLKKDYSVAKEYCFCCGGHFKHHYEIMLGTKLKVAKVISSPLDSDGEKGCVFLLELLK